MFRLGLRLKSITKKVAVIYGIWVLLWTSIALYGRMYTTHGEFGVSSHLWLTMSGFPLSFLSWLVPHGSILGVFVAGVAGLDKWHFVDVKKSRYVY